MQCLSLVHTDSNDITYVASIKEQGYQYAKRLKQTFVVVLQLRENGIPMQIARLRAVSLLWPSLRLGSVARIFPVVVGFNVLYWSSRSLMEIRLGE